MNDRLPTPAVDAEGDSSTTAGPARGLGTRPGAGDDDAPAAARGNPVVRRAPVRRARRNPADRGGPAPGGGGRGPAGRAPASTLIVSSPLLRARQTAQAVARATGAPLQSDDGLAELDFGEWEGLTIAEASRRWPDEVTAWLGDVDGGAARRRKLRRRYRAGRRRAGPAAGRAPVPHPAPGQPRIADQDRSLPCAACAVGDTVQVPARRRVAVRDRLVCRRPGHGQVAERHRAPAARRAVTPYPGRSSGRAGRAAAASAWSPGGVEEGPGSAGQGGR